MRLRQPPKRRLRPIPVTCRRSDLRDDYELNRLRSSLRLDQTLLSLETVREIQLAAENRNRTGVDLRRAELDLELGITLAYLNHLRARQLRLIEKTSAAQVRQSSQISRVRSELDEGDPSDGIRLEDERLKSVRRLILAEAQLEISRILLNILLGRPGDVESYFEESEFSRKNVDRELYGLDYILNERLDNETVLGYLSAEAVQANPELETADIAISMAQLRLARNSARFFPMIGFRASLDFGDDRFTGSLSDDEQTSWSVGTLFRWPLYLGGSRFKERGRLSAELSGLEYQKDQLLLHLAF